MFFLSSNLNVSVLVTDADVIFMGLQITIHSILLYVILCGGVGSCTWHSSMKIYFEIKEIRTDVREGVSSILSDEVLERKFLACRINCALVTS